MEPADTPVTHCLDCGEVLHGPHCSRCGQRHGEHDLRFWPLAVEAIHTFLNYDARVLSTLRLLFLHPGALTLHHQQGRRTRFVPPVKLYFTISFVLFLLLGLGAGKGRGPEVRRSPSAVIVRATPDASPSQAKSALERGALRAQEDPQAFRGQLIQWMSRVMFALLPAFAFLLFLLFRGSRRFFVEHMVFSLHFHCFAFAIFTLQWFMDRVPWGEVETAGSLLTVLLPIHLGVSLKRVYGGPTWKILLKGGILAGVYLVLVGSVLVGTVLWILSR